MGQEGLGPGSASGDGGTVAEEWAVTAPKGYRIGDWRLTGPIASGSWSSVYAAQRADAAGAADAPAAIKLMPGGRLTPAHQATLRAMATREKRRAAAVRSPGLLPIHEVHVISDPVNPHLDGVTALVMDRAAASLADLLAAAPGEVPLPRAHRLIADIAAAIDSLHAQGWVHADLKPGNVLIMADGRAVLADFGLAAELDGTHAYIEPLGTVDYLPPEWWSSHATAYGVEVRATRDIWAFGILAAHILTGGRHPFPGATPGARASHVRSSEHLPHLPPTVPTAWRELIHACLDRDEQARAGLVGRLALRTAAAQRAEAPRSPDADSPAPPNGVTEGRSGQAGSGSGSARGSRRPATSALSLVVAALMAGVVGVGATLAVSGRTGDLFSSAPAPVPSASATRTTPVPQGSGPVPADTGNGPDEQGPSSYAPDEGPAWSPGPLPAALRLSRPVPATGESMVAMLRTLVPDSAKTSGYEGHNTDGRQQGRLTLDDGQGPASVVVNVDPAGPGTVPRRCEDLSPLTSIRVIACADHPLPGGGWAHITSIDFTGNGADPNDRNKIQNSVSILRPDGVSVQAVTCNGPCGALGPAVRPSPPLTTRQLYTIASDPRWRAHMERDFVDRAASITLQGTGSH
ncbi:protein kinase [Streptomyces sp. NPDC049837]|uniref:serine/threonine protein kinase n=1 Tax=Streptomyces sp. NPDC049837 TaxID=3155277 RepID=UPI003444F1E6